MGCFSHKWMEGKVSIRQSSSFAAGSDDFEVLIDIAVTINASLESVKDLVAFNKLAKDSLVAIEVVCGAEGDREFGSSRVLSVVGEGQLATFIVSQSHVLILKANTKGTNVLFADTAGRDSKSGHTLVELGSDIGVSLGAIAECLERVSGLWLFLGVELEDEVTDALIILGDSDEHSRVRSAAVAVQCAEAALA